MKHVYGKNFVWMALVFFFVLTTSGFSETPLAKNTEIGDKQVSVNIIAGKYWEDTWPIFLFINKATTPQVAIWMEDTKGNFLKNIYISQKAATQGWVGLGTLRRKASLPYWAHRRGIQYPDGLYLPTSDDPLPDAFTGATPKGDFDVSTSYDEKTPNRIKIFAEFNSSGNFNEDYPEDDFFGQPSVVYMATVDLLEKNTHQSLQLVGHGHPKGDTGELFLELGKLTTALNIIEEVTVQIKELK